jgi:predicted RNA-binding protein with PIN domain
MYLIDGHNLIGYLPDISLDDPNDEALLVQKLAGVMARLNKRCVGVFDYGLPGGSSRMSTYAVQVVFASQRTTADKVIIARIGKIRDPINWTVVTSDREVRAIARGRNMTVMTSAEFADFMQAPPKPEVDAGEAAHVSLSAEEVDEWLKLFGGEVEPPRAKAPRPGPREK